MAADSWMIASMATQIITPAAVCRFFFVSAVIVVLSRELDVRCKGAIHENRVVCNSGRGVSPMALSSAMGYCPATRLSIRWGRV